MRSIEPSQVKLNWQPVGAIRTLIDDPADRRGKARVVDPVEHDLRDSPLAIGAFASSFVVNRLGKAGKSPRFVLGNWS